MSSDRVRAAAALLLERAGLGGSFRVEPVAGGANSRAHRIDRNGQSFFLKEYFRHPSDPRDRLGADFSFSRFAWDRRIKRVPRPYAMNEANGFGLYEFIDGDRVRPGQVLREHVRQALDFYSEINRHRGDPEALALGPASEAFFRAADHVDCVEGRLQALRRIEPADESDRAALRFVEASLYPVWLSVREWVEQRARSRGLSLRAEIPRGDRCISPSDFGFHNALTTARGGLKFFDFEYSGWDDPAKTVCDFFCQVAVPVPPDFYAAVVDAIASLCEEPEWCKARVAVLQPVFRVKWCCIVLNEFLPSACRRRAFAAAPRAVEQAKKTQLSKARRILAESGLREETPWLT